MLKLSLSVRTLSTTSQLLKDGDMIQAIFLKKIREFAQKVAAGQLMRPAEVGFFIFVSYLLNLRPRFGRFLFYLRVFMLSVLDFEVSSCFHMTA